MPIIALQRRLAEVGRIRTGQQVESKGRKRPVALTTFRFTSRDRQRLDEVAQVCGGKVEKWGDEFEVVSETSSLAVAVPPGETLSQWYEMWGRPSQRKPIVCLRRCDGETEMLTGGSCRCPAEDAERRDLANDGRACKPVTRLGVILRELPGIGVWRLDSHGFYAAVELAASAGILEEATRRGILLPARLRLEQRTRTTIDGLKRFVVPRLDIDVTFNELIADERLSPGVRELDRTTGELTVAAGAGNGNVRALNPPKLDTPGPAPRPGLRAAVKDVQERPTTPPRGPRSAEPIGARAVEPRADVDLPLDDEEPPDETPAPPENETAPADEERAQLARRIKVLEACERCGLDDATRHEVIRIVTNGVTSSAKTLTGPQYADVIRTLERIEAGELAVTEAEKDVGILETLIVHKSTGLVATNLNGEQQPELVPAGKVEDTADVATLPRPTRGPVDAAWWREQAGGARQPSILKAARTIAGDNELALPGALDEVDPESELGHLLLAWCATQRGGDQ